MYFLPLALGVDVCASDESSADLVIWSVFPDREIKEIPKHLKSRLNWFYTGENVRPNFEIFDAVFSFDFSNRVNAFRLPIWWFYLDWNSSDSIENFSDNAINPAILHKSRSLEILESRTVSAFIGNPTRMRSEVISFMPESFDFHGFGTLYENPVESKMKYKEKFEFNICFENSYFPGYHTEKLLHAWAMQTIPLYYGAKTVNLEFNPRSFINLSDFPSIESFWSCISNLSRDDKDQILNSPLLLKPLETKSFTDFLYKQIHDDGR